jgi:glycerol kinase
MVNVGETPVFSKHGLLTTVAYQMGPEAPVIYALEGSIAVAGAAVQWLRDNLKIVDSGADCERKACPFCWDRSSASPICMPSMPIVWGWDTRLESPFRIPPVRIVFCFWLQMYTWSKRKATCAQPQAKLVDDNGDVYFVPAFSGLFAPYWREDARGTIVGMTMYTNQNHICRAVIESMCYQVSQMLGLDWAPRVALFARRHCVGCAGPSIARVLGLG